MIRRIREDHLESVKGGVKPRCVCSEYCPCTDNDDGAIAFQTYAELKAVAFRPGPQ